MNLIASVDLCTYVYSVQYVFYTDEPFVCVGRPKPCWHMQAGFETLPHKWCCQKLQLVWTVQGHLRVECRGPGGFEAWAYDPAYDGAPTRDIVRWMSKSELTTYCRRRTRGTEEIIRLIDKLYCKLFNITILLLYLEFIKLLVIHNYLFSVFRRTHQDILRGRGQGHQRGTAVWCRDNDQRLAYTADACCLHPGPRRCVPVHGDRYRQESRDCTLQVQVRAWFGLLGVVPQPKFIPGTTASDTHFQLYLLDGLVRYVIVDNGDLHHEESDQNRRRP